MGGLPAAERLPAGRHDLDRHRRGGAARARRAVGYVLPRVRVGVDFQFTRPDPAQGLWSTVGDLFRFQRALDAGKIVSPAARDAILGAQSFVQRGEHAYDTVRATGGDVRLVSAGLVLDWMPDGRSLAVQRPVGSGRDWFVVVVSSTGSVGRRLLPENAIGATLSPDGRLLAFTTSLYGGAAGRAAQKNWLVVRDLQRKQQWRVSSVPGFYQVRSGAWSRDSGRLAYTRRRSIGALSAGVFVADPSPDWASARVARVAGDGNNGASWSPDGTRLAFNRGISCNATILTVASGATERFPHEACEPVWRPRP